MTVYIYYYTLCFKKIAPILNDCDSLLKNGAEK